MKIKFVNTKFNDAFFYRKKQQILNIYNIVLFVKDIKHQDLIIAENVRFCMNLIFYSILNLFFIFRCSLCYENGSSLSMDQ